MQRFFKVLALSMFLLAGAVGCDSFAAKPDSEATSKATSKATTKGTSKTRATGKTPSTKVRAVPTEK